MLQAFSFGIQAFTQEAREGTFPVVRSTKNRTFLLRAVPVVLLGQSDVISSQRHVTDSSQYQRPFASLGQLAICQAATRTRRIARVCKRGWLCFFNCRATMTPVRFTSSAQHSFGLLRRQSTRRSLPTQLPDTQCLEHCLRVSPFTSTMKRRWCTRRVEGVNTPLDRQFGIAEQGLLRVKHGVCFGDPVPHAGLRATTIVQPRAQCLQALHHSPDPAFAAAADDLNNISRFVLCKGASDNVETFLIPSHAQTFNGVGHVFENTSQVIHCTSHCVQVIRPAQVMENRPSFFTASPDERRRLFWASR